MDDRKKMAFSFASDLTKQLITLATAVIGAVVTFGDKLLFLNVTGPLAWALAIYGLSAVAGGFALMALTGQLGSPKLDENTCSAYAPGVRIFAALQILTFMAATAIFAAAAVGLANVPPHSSP
jgi:hypothetical protein